MKSTLPWASAAAVSTVAAVIACANSASHSPGDNGDGGTDGGFTFDTYGVDGFNVDAPLPGTSCSAPVCNGTDTPCEDFPATPIVDATPEDGSPPTPADAASHFTGAPSTSGGPCVVEPADGVLMPDNWLRPRFRYAPASSSQTLFQIKVHAPGQTNDLVAYTTSKSWKMPRPYWNKLRTSAQDQAIQYTVTAVDMAGGTPTSTSGAFTIAPAGADGAMIYWAATGEFNGQSWLEAFGASDESAVTVLDVSQIQLKDSRDQGGQLMNGNGAVQCIGCHTAVPDGKSVAFLDFWPWGGAAASVEDKHAGEIPAFFTPGGEQAFSLPWLGILAFSKGVWDTSKIAVTTFGCGTPSGGNRPWAGQTCTNGTGAVLGWIDLGTSVAASTATSGSDLGNYMMSSAFGTSFGVIARTGDAHGAAAPTWSHDGANIVYVSTDAEKDGRLDVGSADLWSVPFAGKAGGAATPVSGGSDPSFNEYYPAFSPDDAMLAYDRAPGGSTMYYNRSSEVFVVPTKGGPPTRLVANDPPSCSGASSPGVTNSWPKWSPTVCTNAGKKYYWLIFSSSRNGAKFDPSRLKAGGDVPTSQLYITAIVVDGAGTATTYPALYLWSQPLTNGGFAQSNHTPAWEIVAVPHAPPPK